jgi:hypothetical protein
MFETVVPNWANPQFAEARLSQLDAWLPDRWKANQAAIIK